MSKNDGSEDSADQIANSGSSKKIDSFAGKYFVVYYNNVKVGIFKPD
jgi:hypothetical protein